MKHGSLFSGIGGFDLAAQWMGWENMFHCEWNEFGQKVLKYYWPDAETFKDITKSDFTKYANRIDILTGGFPCQPFSVAGEQLGEADERYLFREMLRAILEIKAPWVVAENVYGITTKKFRELFQVICSSLEVEGYEIQPCIIPASAVGAPHQRDRVFIIAYSDRLSKIRNARKYENPCPEKRVQEWNKIQYSFVSDSVLGNNTNPHGNGLQRNSPEPQTQRNLNGLPEIRGWENHTSEPPILRVDDGISNRVDRVKAYGNAIVPQVALQIFKAIEQFETNLKTKQLP